MAIMGARNTPKQNLSTMSDQQLMMADQALLDALNEQMNREVSTFLRYMLQAASIKGAEYEPVREMYLGEVGDEVAHAQYLANQIAMMGGKPKMDPDLSPPPKTVDNMLSRDVEEERRDVKNYRKLAEMAGEEGFFSLKMRMEEQGAEEDEHAQQMLRLLG